MNTRRHALIVGGAKGIGRAIGAALIAEGWQITIAGRQSRDEALEAQGARWIQVDASDPEAAKAAVAQAGDFDSLVIAAGPYHRAPLMEETPEAWRGMFAHNLDPVLFLAQAALPQMQARGFGRIVTFSIANAERLQANPFIAGHYIAKIGVLVLTRSLAKLAGAHGVTVNAISPGFIDSGSMSVEEMAHMVKHIPAKRLGTVDDAVAAARFLLSEEAGYVNGANIVVSGGWGL